MNLRFVLSDSELGENWITVSRRWTRGELRRCDECTLQQLFDEVLPKKIVECCITDADGNVTNDPKGLTFAASENWDQQVFGFVSSIPKYVSRELFILGSTNGKSLSAGSDEKKSTTTS